MRISRYFSNPYIVVSILSISAVLSLGSYLAGSKYLFRLGYPLDDAWIHQTYARNLGENGAWEFISGQPSAGSTAPAWTFLLALGYWLNLNTYFWTFFLGWLVLSSLAITAYIGFALLVPDYRNFGILAGLLVIFEWHLTWAAGSGMETLLAGLIATIAIISIIHLNIGIMQDKKIIVLRWLGLGLLIGLAIWVRPDLITLLAIVALTLLLDRVGLSVKVRCGLILTAGFLMAGLPYILFNLAIAGEIWPNTFYAKQAEYVILRSTPIWQRYLNMVGQPLTGVGVVLLPGFLWFGGKSLRNKSWAQVSAFIWVFGYLSVYAARLPVTYQHGRYIRPVIPIICLFGLVGAIWLIDRVTSQNWGRILRKTWILVAVIITFSFWILGLRAYSRDVAIIESEMVEMANWVADNIDESSLVAAHDIGALGYFAERNLLDLAGLVSPEVIPFIRDERTLRQYMSETGANYLVTFPGWYPQLIKDWKMIYTTNGQFSPQMGGENMSVFELKQ
jgi:hypothetical protein